MLWVDSSQIWKSGRWPVLDDHAVPLKEQVYSVRGLLNSVLLWKAQTTSIEISVYYQLQPKL